MKKYLTLFSTYVERERERENLLQKNGRRKLLFNFFLNRKRGGGYLISDTSFEVLDYE